MLFKLRHHPVGDVCVIVNWILSGTVKNVSDLKSRIHAHGKKVLGHIHILDPLKEKSVSRNCLSISILVVNFGDVKRLGLVVL